MNINVEIAWLLVKQFAIKAKMTELIYQSLIDKKQYRIINVFEDKIIIQRISGGKNQDLSKNKITKAIELINASNGKVKRSELISPTVAEETTLVLFHPNLTWSSDGSYIETC